MAEIKDIREAMKKKKRAKTVRTVSLIVILAALLVIVFINRSSLTPEAISNWLSGSFSQTNSKEGFPVQLPSGEAVQLECADSNIVLTNQTNLLFYSPRGRQLREIQHARKNVQSVASGENVLVYSVGGNEVSVETHLKTAATLDADNSVITGDIAKNGKFVIATESDVYTSELMVYDKNANPIFKWTPSAGVIASVAISEDGSRVVASTLYTQGGKIISGIYFFSTSKSEALFSQKIENEIVMSLTCDKNSVTVITDAQLININSDGEISSKFSFEEKRLIAHDLCSKGTVLVFRDVNDPSNSVLYVIGDEGEIKSQASLGQKVLGLGSSGNDIYLLTETDAFLYDASTATRRDECSIEDDGKMICANSSGAYIITAASQMQKLNLG